MQETPDQHKAYTTLKKLTPVDTTKVQLYTAQLLLVWDLLEVKISGTGRSRKRGRSWDSNTIITQITCNVVLVGTHLRLCFSFLHFHNVLTTRCCHVVLSSSNFASTSCISTAERSELVRHISQVMPDIALRIFYFFFNATVCSIPNSSEGSYYELLFEPK